ncbi:MAG: hypothetical protein EPO32_06175 [Anaerolineae bacterium]|nr:MAG: hypothetical protein EPO32_06175 [Anaerolineae bacterium]
MRINRPVLTSLFLLACALLLAACSAQPTETPDALPLPAGTAASGQPGAGTGELPTLTVCLGGAPNAIHPYLAPNIWSRTFQEALYPAPYHVENEAIQPGLLDSIPSLGDGSAELVRIEVQMGDRVLTADGAPQELDLGLYVRPAGCNTNDCAVLYNPSQPLFMDQLRVTFKIKSGLTWGDGSPLTAADSVFAYTYNLENFAGSGNSRPAYTASYEAIDDTTVVWTGLPGVIPRSYMTYFWTPLPQKLWEGNEILNSGGPILSFIVPASYGPYQLEDWTEDTFLMYPNPNYTGPDPEGRFAPLVFKVVGDDGEANVARLLSGECDVLDPSALKGVEVSAMTQLTASGQANLLTSNAGAWEVLYFGIKPASYDDGYAPATDRVDFFGDVRVRQGLAHCLNRGALLDAVTAGQGSVMDTYVQSESPLFNAEATQYAYDQQAGIALLEAAGWAAGADGVRVAQGIPTIPDGTRLSLRYFVAENPINEEVAALLEADLAACGVELTVTALPREEYYATGEGTPLFGRDFDLAQYSWSVDSSLEPACHLFYGYTVPGPEGDAFPLGWSGWNVTGWQNQEFDDSCQTARNALPGQEGHSSLHQTAQALFASELPAIPLFTYRQFSLIRPDLCGLQLEDLTGVLYGWENVRFCDS